MTGLADRQAALVEAMVAGGPVPDGFAAAPVEAAREALLRKRAGLAASAWPVLAAELGTDWTRVFARHHAGVPPTDGLREGWDLARALAGRGELGPRGARELAARERELRYDGRLPPRARSRVAVRLRRSVFRAG